MLGGAGGIDATLETVTGVGREIEAPRPAGDRVRPPESGFDIDVSRGVRYRRRRAAHDARERLDTGVVGDDTDLGIEVDRGTAEQLERFARTSPANRQSAGDPVEIEDVRRPAEFEHHVVRDIDQRTDRALAASCQAVDHPARRRRKRVDAAHDAAGEAPAQVRRFDAHRQPGIVSRLDRAHLGLQQRCAGERSDLARQAVDAQQMPQIGRQLEREDLVVERQVAADVGTDRRITRQDQQPGVVVRQPQLATRSTACLRSRRRAACCA